MDASGIHHDVGKATTPDEFHHITLVVAFALSNPCKFHHYFTYVWFILQSDQTDWDVERLADRVKNIAVSSPQCTNCDYSEPITH